MTDKASQQQFLKGDRYKYTMPSSFNNRPLTFETEVVDVTQDTVTLTQTLTVDIHLTVGGTESVMPLGPIDNCPWITSGEHVFRQRSDDPAP